MYAVYIYTRLRFVITNTHSFGTDTYAWRFLPLMESHLIIQYAYIHVELTYIYIHPVSCNDFRPATSKFECRTLIGWLWHGGRDRLFTQSKCFIQFRNFKTLLHGLNDSQNFPDLKFAHQCRFLLFWRHCTHCFIYLIANSLFRNS